MPCKPAVSVLIWGWPITQDGRNVTVTNLLRHTSALYFHTARSYKTHSFYSRLCVNPQQKVVWWTRRARVSGVWMRGICVYQGTRELECFHLISWLFSPINSRVFILHKIYCTHLQFSMLSCGKKRFETLSQLRRSLNRVSKFLWLLLSPGYFSMAVVILCWRCFVCFLWNMYVQLLHVLFLSELRYCLVFCLLIL